MAITKEDLKAVLGHDDFVIVGGVAFEDLQKVGAKLIALGAYNISGARINDFDNAALLLGADASNPPANVTVQAQAAFKHKGTGKVSVHAEYAVDRWATAVTLSQLGVA